MRLLHLPSPQYLADSVLACKPVCDALVHPPLGLLADGAGTLQRAPLDDATSSGCWHGTQNSEQRDEQEKQGKRKRGAYASACPVDTQAPALTCDLPPRKALESPRQADDHLPYCLGR